MKIIMASNGKKLLTLSKTDWKKIGLKAGWITESKKKSPKEHGFIDKCIEENQDKDSPGGYCSSIVDKSKGSKEWRKHVRKD